MPEGEIAMKLLTGQYEVPAPDELIAGDVTPDIIRIAIAGEYKRGMLLMSSDYIDFEPATLAGAKTAASLMILAEDVNVISGEAAFVTGYDEGKFNAASVIFAFETENDAHDSIVEELRGYMRAQHLYMR